MTTWTLRQIDQAKGLSWRTVISRRALLDSDGLIVDAALKQAGLELVEAGHTFGIEIHPDDLRIETSEMSEVCAVAGTVRWRPSTREVVLVGGPCDGSIYALRTVGEPLTVLARSLKPSTLLSPQTAAIRLDLDRVIYRLGGWHETDRRWVYTP